MSATFNVPTPNRLATLRQLGAVKRLSASAMLTEASRTLARYLIQATPPFNRNPFGQSVWAAQKRIGTAAINRDFAKSFRPFTTEEIHRYTKNVNGHNARWIRRYAKAGQLGKLNTLLTRLGMPSSIKVIRFVNIDLARRNVFFGSRPHKIKQKYLVIDRSSIKRERDLAISHIGRAKAGWMPAAQKVGYQGAPEWVKRNAMAASGSVIDQRSNDRTPSVTMINNTTGADAKDDDVVFAAMRQLDRSLLAQMRAVMTKHSRNFNRR